jgi:hypothetical protein
MRKPTEPGHLNIDTRVEAIALRRDLPDVAQFAYLAGSWIWVRLPENTPRAAELTTRGYSFSRRKGEWYNPCGVLPERKGRRRSGDHKRYGTIPIDPDNTRVEEGSR